MTIDRSEEATRPPREPAARDLLDPGLCLALGFGAGLAPRAPGTFGTLAGIVVHFLLTLLPAPMHAVALAGLIAAGVPICGRAARLLGRHDHPAIVWDELACVPVALVGLPVQWAWIVAGFLAFRLFDVLKPWPVSVLDRRMKGGAGIMADDLVAALLAGAGLHAAAAVTGAA